MTLIRIERPKGTAAVFFARPPVNAFNLQLVEELHVRLNELAEDVPAAGIVVTGDGRALSAGVDFKSRSAYTQDIVTREERM
jgi:enoyl-CoA hydratase/carnithine racemase